MAAKIILSFLVFLTSQHLTLAQVDCVVSGDCTGQDDGRVPDCSDCKSYFLCENEALVFGKTCPSILFFNPDTMKCDIQDNVQCATTSLTSGTSATSVTSETSLTSESYNCITGCYGLLSGFFASCDSCEDYFDCPSGVLQTCASGTLFDSESRNCQPDGMASCLTTSATSETSVTSVTSNSSPSSKTSMSSVTSSSSETSATSPTSLNSESPTSSPLSDQSVTSRTSMTTSEAVFCLSETCGDQPDGYYADCQDCQSYFQCNGGTTNKITCSLTLLFNPSTMLCDYDYNVACQTTSGTSMTSFSSMTSLSSDSSPSSRSSGSSPSSRTSMSSLTSEAVYCVTDCVGIPDGQYPNCDDCSSAITCTSQTLTSLFSCSSPLVLDPVTMNCNYQSNVVCATTTTSATSLTSMTSDQSAQSQVSEQSMTSEDIFCIISCTGQPDGRWASCSNCAAYYDCLNEAGTEVVCGANLQFNSQSGFCDLPSSVVCATTSLQSVTSGSSPSSQSSDSSQASMLSDQSSTSQTSPSSMTSQSSQSSDSSPTSLSSSTSLYSPTSEPPFCVTSCDGVPAGFWPDCNDCRMYYVCGVVNREYDCDPLFYNPDTQRCARAADVTCATTSGTSATSITSDSSPSSQSSQTSMSSQTSDTSMTSQSSPSSGTSPTSLSSETSEQSETSAFSETSQTSTKPFCLTGCIGVDGVFADCNDCQAYYICNGASETAVTCGASTYYNPDTEQCSFTQNCQTTSATSITSITSRSSPSSVTSMSSDTSLTSLQSLQSETSQSSDTSRSSASSETSMSSRTSETSASSPISLTSEAIDCLTSCAGAPMGLYADCTTCNGYYDCANTLTRKECETGLYWEKANMRCGVDNGLCVTTSVTSKTSMTSVASLTSEEGSGDVMDD